MTDSILTTGLQLVQKTLDAIPPGKQAAFVVQYDTDGNTLRAGFAARLDDQWVLAADIEQALAKEPPRGHFWIEWSR